MYQLQRKQLWQNHSSYRRKLNVLLKIRRLRSYSALIGHEMFSPTVRSLSCILSWNMCKAGSAMRKIRSLAVAWTSRVQGHPMDEAPGRIPLATNKLRVRDFKTWLIVSSTLKRHLWECLITNRQTKFSRDFLCLVSNPGLWKEHKSGKQEGLDGWMSRCGNGVEHRQ